MKVFLLAAFFAVPVLAHAQMLLVDPRAEDPDLLQFNSEFIARNGVKSVNGQLWTKQDGRPMLPLDRFFQYRFGAAGLVDRSFDIFGKVVNGMDTASVIYNYDKNGRCLQEIHNDLHGFYALRTEYGPEGLPVRETHVRLENLNADRSRFDAGASTVISDERYLYGAVNDTVMRKTFLNDRGRPYQEETYTMDRLGYLRTVEMQNLITQRRGRSTFTYDAKGRLAERTGQTDLAVPTTSTWRWTYDAAGNPLTRDLLHNGSLVRHGEFLYAEGTLFLKAVITKNDETGMIEVLRFDVAR